MPYQIADLQLPTRPTKRTDSRSKGFSDVSVELDAIPPDILRTLVRDTIELHLPDGFMDDIKFAEAEEKRVFARMVREIG